MSEADTTLRGVHDQLGTILEDRVTELMTEIKTAQAITRHIARTEEEIERQRLLKDKLESELGPMRQRVSDLTSTVDALRQQLDGATDAAARLAEIRDELAALQAQGEEA